MFHDEYGDEEEKEVDDSASDKSKLDLSGPMDNWSYDQINQWYKDYCTYLTDQEIEQLNGVVADGL